MLTSSCDPSLRHSANTSCTQWWPLALALGREWGCEQGGQLPASQRPRPSQPLTRWTGTGLSPSAPLLDGGSRRAGPALRPVSCSQPRSWSEQERGEVSDGHHQMKRAWGAHGPTRGPCSGSQEGQGRGHLLHTQSHLQTSHAEPPQGRPVTYCPQAGRPQQALPLATPHICANLLPGVSALGPVPVPRVTPTSQTRPPSGTLGVWTK